MAKEVRVAPSSLVLYKLNPRFATQQSNAQAALEQVVRLGPEKALRLAGDIAQHGMDPLGAIAVGPANPQGLREVFEGNRRVAALQMLESPTRVAGVLDSRQLAQLERYAAQYAVRRVDSLSAVEFTDASWRRWVRLRHTGENEGAGLVGWDRDAQGRFTSDGDGLKPAQQLLDYLEARGVQVRDNRGQVRYLSTLERILNDPDVRGLLGVDFQDGSLRVSKDRSKVMPALTELVTRLKSRELRVNAVMGKKDRVGEMRTLANQFDLTKAPALQPSPLEEAHAVKAVPPVRQATGNTPRKSVDRERLIPSRVKLNITSRRVRDIYVELRTVKVENFTNLASVGLRVFLELSVDEYIARNPAAAPANSIKLSDKIKSVAQFMEANGDLTAAQRKALNKMCEKASEPLAVSTFELHQYVHNPHVFPTPVDLKRAWDGLETFFAVLWP